MPRANHSDFARAARATFRSRARRANLSRGKLALAVGAACADALVSHRASAQIATGWKGTSSSLWTDAGNWDNTGPNAGARDLFFGNAWVTAGGAGSTTANNDIANWAGHKIVFESNASTPAFTITGNGFRLFDFGGASPVFPQIVNASNANQTFNLSSGSIQLNDTSGSNKAEILANGGGGGGGGNLSFSSSTPIDLAGTTQLQFNSTAGRTITFDGVISSSGNGGNNSVSINGANVIVYGAANTYAGDTFINAGTLQFSLGGSASSSIIRLGDTGGSNSATFALTSASGGQSVGSTFVVRSGSSGTRTFKSINTGGTNTWTGSIYLDADLTISEDNSTGTLAFTGTEIDLKNQTLTVNTAGSVTIGNVVKNTGGTGKLIKSGGGVLTLAGANTYDGLTTINSGGTIQLASATALGTTTGGTTVSSGGALDLNGQAVGAEGLTLNGTGISSGGALINSSVTPASHSGAVSLATASSVGGSGSLTLSGVISGTSLTKVGPGVLTPSNTANMYGSITINAGTVSVAADRNLGAVPGAATDNIINFTGGALRFTSSFSTALNRNLAFNAGSGTIDVSANQTGTFLGILKGTAGYNKTGSGTLVLSNASNAVTGAVSVTGGTLEILTASQIGGAGAGAGNITLNGGVLRNDNTGASVTFLTGNRGIIIGASGGTIDVPGTSSTIQVYTSGSITGAGNTLTKSGPGTLRNTTPTSTTFSRLVVTGGLYQGASDDIFGAVPAAFTADAITLSGGGGISSNVGLTWHANRGLTLGAGGGVINTASSGTFSSVITGSGGLTKSGSNILQLTGNNDFSGGLTLAAGRINFNHNNAAGTGSITVTSGAGEFVTTAAGITLSNNITLNSGAAPKLYATSGNSLTLSGQISGAGGFLRDDNGAGTMTLNGDNSFAGGLNITSRGGFFFGHKNAAGAGVLTLGDPVNAPGTAILLQTTVDLTGSSAMPNATTWNQSFTIQGSSGFELSGAITLGNAAPTATVTNSGTTIFSGNIGGAAGFGFAKSGAGGLAVLGAKSFTGQVILSQGTLTVDTIANIGVNSSLGAGSAALNFGTAGAATLELIGAGAQSTNRGISMSMPNGAKIRIADAAGKLTISGAIAGSGNFDKYGLGTLAISGAHAYSGTVTINGGPLSINNVANTGTSSGLGTGSAGSTVTIGNGNDATLSYTGPNSSTNRPIAIGAAGGSLATIESTASTLTLTGGINNNAKALTFDGAGSVTVSTSGITGGGAVTKNGGGVLTLNVSNTIGDLTINDGTVALGSGGSVNSTLITVGTSAGSDAKFDVSSVSGGYTLASGQTIRGHGSVAGNATIAAGTIAPGTSTGILSSTGSLTLQTGATALMELDGDGGGGAGVAGTNFDQIALAGAGVVFTPGGATLNVVPMSNATTGVQYAIVTAASGASISLATIFANLPEDTPYEQGLGVKYKLNYTSNEIDLTFISVPEPTGALLGAIVGVGALARRRSRRKR